MIAVAACKICLGIMPIAFSAPKSLQSASRFYRVMLASAVFAVMQCPSVRPSRSWITSKRLNISSSCECMCVHAGIL